MTFTEVKRAHIVPRMYQEAWATSGRVTVHVLDDQGNEIKAVPMPISHAGTRNRFYRRERPDGSTLDDTEAALAHVEGLAAPVLREAVNARRALTFEEKGGLAQFIGVQMLRGPRFFEQRADLLEPLIAQVPQGLFKPDAIRDARGDLATARAHLLAAYVSNTQSHLTMLASALKLGMILGNMRWELLTFSDPVVAYSDHPVFVWPGPDDFAEPQRRQSLGPLNAAEVVFPLGPHTLLVTNWIDRPDPAPSVASEDIAAQSNAFVVAQADRQWMHQSNADCPIAGGPFRSITSANTPGYDAEALGASVRRAFASRELERNNGRVHLRDLRILDLQDP